VNQALQELAAHGAPMPFKGLSIVTAAVGMASPAKKAVKDCPASRAAMVEQVELFNWEEL